MLPNATLLSVALRIDNVIQLVTSLEMRVTIDAVAVDEAGQWCAAPAVECGALAAFGNEHGLEVIVRFDASLLGLPSDPTVAEPEVWALVPGVAQHQQAAVTFIRHTFANGRLTLAGAAQLQSGEVLALDLVGRPTLVSANVMLAAGRVGAQALLDQHWPDQHDGDVCEFATDETLLLRWQPREFAEQQQQQQAARALARAEAAAQAARQAIEDARAMRGPLLHPTIDQPLFAMGRLHPVADATLVVRRYAGKFALELELSVDASSGEDGALAPRFFVVVDEVTLPEVGATIVVGPAVESWLGNDALELVDHRFAIQRLPSSEIYVDWTASYDDWETKRQEPLHFAGVVALSIDC